ncbi:hypothetical protein EYF80_022166 [Liparis tanakae]|uniref:Uncharacterized protein n=1 Tax=Liparis tanakae TaxID=230148 RepID=A0A4Z2HP96_9TELE|nr:hypothetical protein EYF80_022166 [Liparis tanakae]
MESCCEAQGRWLWGQSVEPRKGHGKAKAHCGAMLPSWGRLTCTPTKEYKGDGQACQLIDKKACQDKQWTVVASPATRSSHLSPACLGVPVAVSPPIAEKARGNK